MEDNYEDEEEYVESEDPYLMRMLNDDNVLKYIKMFHEFQLLDTHAALPIVIDLHDLETRDIDMDSFASFVDECYNKHTLEIYDQPGDPRIAGYYHLKAKGFLNSAERLLFMPSTGTMRTTPRYISREQMILGKTKQFKEVNRMSGTPDCYPFFHMTFTVVDKLTKEEVIQFAIGQLQLGMLRDASHDRVLAAIRFKDAPTGDTYDHLKEQLKHVWETIMMQDDSKDSC